MNSPEIKAMLACRPDCAGECDGCHEDKRELWEDQSQPGEYVYCEACWRKRLAKKRS